MFFPFLKKHALLSSFIFFSITAYLNGWLATNYPYYEKSNKQLYDVLFNYLTPPISRMYADIIILLLTIYFAVRYLYKNAKVASKFFVLIGILYVFRALTFTLTETPEPSRFQKTCINKSVFKLADVKWFKLNPHDSCIDHMFSGHSLFGISITIFILSLSNNITEKILVSLSTLALLVSLIWSRAHYTQDVLVALFMTMGWSKVILNCKYFD